ncbi:MAG TPA: NAD(P)/FAD-dependent oxidoreductase [Mycobacteriales bacterium]|nr:NAD(P)/FAD-dependent oxidoreductase [Mycobacteriales bacterium]
MTDAVVVGAGPNGLVAANLLADAGWTVLVLEAEPTPGGAVRSEEIAPGFVADRFSAFYPFAAASPVVQSLHLDEWGLRWSRSPLVMAHPHPDGSAAVLSTDMDATAAALDAVVPGDGDAWRELVELWDALGDAMLHALFRPMPPLRPALRLARQLGLAGGVRFARFGLTPVRAMAAERFAGPDAGLLLAGNALHSDLSPEATGSGLYGWLLAMLGQRLGFPVPVGGAQALTDALVRRLESRGGAVQCDVRVTQVVVRGGAAVGVRTEDGTEHPARRAVLADVDAPTLYRRLLAEEHVPTTLRRDLSRFDWDWATVKVDWALDRPVPWTAEAARGAGTVHLADGMDGMSAYTSELARGLLPASRFLVLGQMTTSDATRSPAGTESAWAYTHVPQHVRGDADGDLTGSWSGEETARYAERMEAQVERFAPGFRDSIRARSVLSPLGLKDADGNLHRGALNGGTAALHQQLVFRPTPGLGRAETPVRGLYLASASAHPGGGVHGGPGAIAARTALAHVHPVRRVGAGLLAAAHRHVQSSGGPGGT